MQRQAHLTNGGAELYLQEIAGALIVKYWGRKLNGNLAEFQSNRSIPNSDFDQIQYPGINREHSRGWLGYPTISGHRSGKNWSTNFVLDDLTSTSNSSSAKFVDNAAKLKLNYEFTLDEFGILSIGA